MLEFIKQYPALLEKNETGGYGVFFPYLPGLGTAGDTYQEALSMAKEALNIYLADMIDDREDVPHFNLNDVVAEARELNAIVAMIEPDKWQLMDMVKRPQRKRVNITILDGVLELADQLAQKLKTSRSDIIEKGLRAIM